jgi:hypothetical protein
MTLPSPKIGRKRDVLFQAPTCREEAGDQLTLVFRVQCAITNDRQDRSLQLACYTAMTSREHDLRMIRRHVRQGERHVLQQRAVVAALELQGHPTKIALELLASFEQTLSNQKAHLDRLLAE